MRKCKDIHPTVYDLVEDLLLENLIRNKGKEIEESDSKPNQRDKSKPKYIPLYLFYCPWDIMRNGVFH